MNDGDYVVYATSYEWSDKREEVISVNRYFNFRFLNKVAELNADTNLTFWTLGSDEVALGFLGKVMHCFPSNLCLNFKF